MCLFFFAVSSGYPVLAEEVTTLFSLDECGICVYEVQSSVLPKKKGGPGPLRRFLNKLGVRTSQTCVEKYLERWVLAAATSREP